MCQSNRYIPNAKSDVAERHDECSMLGQSRSTQRKVPQGQADEQRLTDDIIELAETTSGSSVSGGAKG